MKVAMYYNNKDIRLEEMPTPKIGPEEFLVKVMASGICGTDVLEWYRIKTAPRVLGHEMAGEIVEVGENVKKYKKGDSVFATHHVPCNTCHYCLNGHHTACDTLHHTNYDPGGFAEYIRIPAINVDRGTFILPGAMSYEVATFIEPLGCVARGQRLMQMTPGSTVLIIGSGISGLLHLKLAKVMKAEKIITADINEYRLKKSLEFGADAVINANKSIPERLREINKGKLSDIVIVCTGAQQACTQALQCVEPGGTILFFAVPKPGIDIPVPISDLWRNEVRMITSYGAAPNDLAEALELLATHRVEVEDMVTHRLPLEETGKGFQLVASAGESIKIIIEPHGYGGKLC
ncbi:alcohol dehydrogenase [Candidatus Desantisbacteria bacterium CG1_02_38_46]|uniref:Alcohol dehydrogenase n=3 Tax=unclassified Candidatus Desantisiibacteriota TaxID=3106372 RepID=A0A2H9PAN1_9BACT|nr:MAG: alcohol dehydrogenase [Candidatus Desantisbacteria bacterium CG1_02_38_46]PIU52051.1 MAG: alcohol dehydrogenase [Candidatus Desantisbacteria bacterium CG07_land_8_20_14_0_80_39_15]PIZ15565.1 MAG: alcohol dehydrogenase [Candidatus Desantisbacteria bacterium CG_4_10_14_0_8_um_filter_39_17]